MSKNLNHRQGLDLFVIKWHRDENCGHSCQIGDESVDGFLTRGVSRKDIILHWRKEHPDIEFDKDDEEYNVYQLGEGDSLTLIHTATRGMCGTGNYIYVMKHDEPEYVPLYETECRRTEISYNAIVEKHLKLHNIDGKIIEDIFLY